MMTDDQKKQQQQPRLLLAFRPQLRSDGREENETEIIKNEWQYKIELNLELARMWPTAPMAQASHYSIKKQTKKQF